MSINKKNAASVKIYFKILFSNITVFMNNVQDFKYFFKFQSLLANWQWSLLPDNKVTMLALFVSYKIKIKYC